MRAAIVKAVRAIRRDVWSYAFILPMAVLFLVFTVYPLLASFRYTLYNWSGIGEPTDFVGLEHYSSILRDRLFWNAFRNTVIYTGWVVGVQLALALALAAILNSRRLFWRTGFRMLFFSPTVTSPAIIGVVISLLLLSVGRDISGLLIRLGFIGRPVDWLGNPITALPIVIAVGVWIGLGYPTIYFLAGLQSIDEELYDAARVDGADALRLFWHITVPSMKPVVAVVLLLITLQALRVFDVVQSMTRGGPYFASDVVGTYIYRLAFFSTGVSEGGSNLGFAAAAAFFMGLLVMAVSLLQLLLIKVTGLGQTRLKR